MIDLLEASRRELINKSRAGDKTKSYGVTRYDRRSKQRIATTVSSFNKIDMNALFKGNIISFIVPVRGETSDYEVEILFEGICDEFKKEIKRNGYKLEYKCIYRALVNSINREDVYISCSCPDYQFRFAYWGTKNRYNSGRPETRPAKETNPNDSQGAGCKHIMKVLANLDWTMKLASTIFNYVIYMRDHFPNKFANIIYPAIFDLPYDEAVNQGLLTDEEDDLELANTMDNEDDVQEVDDSNAEGRVRGQFKPKEKEEPQPESTVEETTEEEVEDNGA